MPLEVEFKLALASAAEREAIARLAGPCLATQQQSNHYFAGTPAWDAAGLVLRLREQDGSWWLALKGLGQADGALHRREEFERELPADEARALREDPAGLSARLRTALQESVGHPLLDRLPSSAPRALGTLRNTRRVHELDTGLRLELDETHYPGGHTAFELEAELEAADPVAAAAAERRLRELLGEAGVPWRPSTGTKFARFLEALGRS